MTPRMQPGEFGSGGRGCPNCGTGDPVHLLFGMPREPLPSRSVLLGCMSVPHVPIDNSLYECATCATVWRADVYGRRFVITNEETLAYIRPTMQKQDAWLDGGELVLAATDYRRKMRLHVGDAIWVVYAMGDQGPGEVQGFAIASDGGWEVFVGTQKGQTVVVRPAAIFNRKGTR